MMMLGLPGISPLTEQWMSQLLGAINLDQTALAIQQYLCWSNPGSKLNLDVEAKIAVTFNPDIFIAKSIGTRVALYAFKTNLMTTRACIFIGTPIRAYTCEEIGDLQRMCSLAHMLFIQQTDDPTGPYSTLSSSIQETSSCKMREVPGSDHFYGNIDLLKEIIESWYRDISC